MSLLLFDTTFLLLSSLVVFRAEEPREALAGYFLSFLWTWFFWLDLAGWLWG